MLSPVNESWRGFLIKRKGVFLFLQPQTQNPSSIPSLGHPGFTALGLISGVTDRMNNVVFIIVPSNKRLWRPACNTFKEYLCVFLVHKPTYDQAKPFCRAWRWGVICDPFCVRFFCGYGGSTFCSALSLQLQLMGQTLPQVFLCPPTCCLPWWYLLAQ